MHTKIEFDGFEVACSCLSKCVVCVASLINHHLHHADEPPVVFRLWLAFWRPLLQAFPLAYCLWLAYVFVFIITKQSDIVGTSGLFLNGVFVLRIKVRGSFWDQALSVLVTRAIVFYDLRCVFVS